VAQSEAVESPKPPMTKTLVTGKNTISGFNISVGHLFKPTDITPDRSPVIRITIPYDRIYAKPKAI